MELSEKITHAIKARLEYLRMNRTEFAELCGVQPSTITTWLKGNHNFELKTIVKIEQALKFDLISISEGHKSEWSHPCYPYTITVNGKLVFESTKKLKK